MYIYIYRYRYRYRYILMNHIKMENKFFDKVFTYFLNLLYEK